MTHADFPRVFIGLLIAVCFIGCSGYQYVASPRYVPLNEKKGDINANISISAAQLGYAFCNNFSVFATGFKRRPSEFEEEKWLEGEYYRNCESGEINLGLTYFAQKGNLSYEIVTGGGFGDMEFSSRTNDDYRGSGNYSLDLAADKWNTYIQPNFRINLDKRLDKHLAVAVFTKFNYVHYYNIAVTHERYDTIIGARRAERVHDLSPDPMYDDGLVYFSSHQRSNSFFIEPGVFIKAGGPYFKAYTQISYVINAGGPSMYYQPLSISIGCSINFNAFDFGREIKTLVTRGRIQ